MLLQFDINLLNVKCTLDTLVVLKFPDIIKTFNAIGVLFLKGAFPHGNGCHKQDGEFTLSGEAE